MPFFENITKLKPSGDPNASKKAEKVLATEALGLVMSDYGGELRDDYGRSELSGLMGGGCGEEEIIATSC